MMDRSTNIIPLNERNYSTWKIQLRMLLMKDDLLNIVEGKETAPTTPTGGGTPTETPSSDLIKFNARKNKALAQIVLHVDTKLLYLLGDPTCPVEVWKKIQDTFQKKSWSNKLRLRKRLYNLKLKPNDDLQAHLKNFVEVFEALAVIGDAVEEEDRVISLLASLPDSYSTLVTALESLEKVPTWAMVTEKLIHFEDKLKSAESEFPEEKVLYTKKRYHNYSKKNSYKCYECGGENHIRKNCPSLKQRKKNFHGKPVVNTVSSNDNEGIILLASSVSALNICVNRNDFVIDSGATNHMCFDKSLFKNISNIDENISVKVGDGSSLPVEGKGDVRINIKLPTKRVIKCHLKNVLYVPKLAHNLISVSQIAQDGKEIKFFKNSCKILNDGRIVAYGNKVDNLYFLKNVTNDATGHPKNDEPEVEVAAKASLMNGNLLHRRFCHMNYESMRKMISNDCVRGLNPNIKIQNDLCESCCDGKNHQTPFPSKTDEDHKYGILGLIHTDVCGKLTPQSMGGGSYFVTFIDDFSKYCWIYILKQKSDVFHTFKIWKAMVENMYQSKIKVIRSDNGGEYVSKEFENFLQNEGIVHQTSIPKTPQQNGVSERKNRSLIEKVRCMISDSGLPKTFWAEALNTANHVINRSPSAAIDNMTPYEKLNNVKPKVDYFRVFGSECFAHVPKDERSKLDPKSRKCIFIGYSSVKKGYKLYDQQNMKVIFSRDVIMNETKTNGNFNENLELKDHELHESGIPISNFESDHESELSENIPDVFEDAIDDVEHRQSTRVSRPVDRYGDWCYSTVSMADEPKSVQEAINGPESAQWIAAMESEISSMKINDVWDLVDPMPDRKVIKSKWVFKRKINVDGAVSYKARLVAQGFNQQPGLDYTETFSPVVSFDSIRTIFAISAKNDFKLHHMDVSSAFLNGNLKENILMSQPEYFVEDGNEHKVCKLKKAIYGLKQSSKCWHDSFSKFLKNLGFQQSDSDSCIFIAKSGNEIECIIALYVDDLLISCRSDSFLKNLKSKLMKNYRMKDLGEVKQFLGVNVEQNENEIFIHQSNFVQNLLQKFQFENCKPMATPVDVSNKLKISTEDDKLFDVELFQKAVGSLLYLSTKTRPDISYAVNSVAKYCVKPNINHWCAVKRIFRYLKGTINLGISYERNKIKDCSGYSDADWAGDNSDRKSTSGYCFSLNSGLISWRSNKQSCVALSTAEAELVALSSAAQEAVWLQKLLIELNYADEKPILLFEDNQSTICLAKSNKSHSKSKHMDIKYNFVKDMVNKNKVLLEYCPSSEMLADIFTKGLPSERFSRLRLLLGMKSLQ